MKPAAVPTVELDHLQYIRSRPYRRATNAAVRQFAQSHPSCLSRLAVLHEADASCCNCEPWLAT